MIDVTRSDALQQTLAFMQPRFPGHALDPADDIFALGFVNSLFAMELVVFVETTFGFTVPNEELRLDNFRTADAVADLVERSLQAGVR
jgi:methoxymalonate biosynthesis acyl carrier protein